jgi:hypothetical protein
MVNKLACILFKVLAGLNDTNKLETKIIMFLLFGNIRISTVIYEINLMQKNKFPVG